MPIVNDKYKTKTILKPENKVQNNNKKHRT